MVLIHVSYAFLSELFGDPAQKALLDRALTLLPLEERAYVTSKKNPHAMAQSLAARWLLYRSLPQKAEEPATPSIRRGAHGRPYFEEKGYPLFALAHAGHLAVCATEDTATYDVGIDVEPIRTDREEHFRQIANRFFTEDERDCLMKAEDFCLSFLRIWTRKEAYLKLSGRGIQGDLKMTDTLRLAKDSPFAFDEYVLTDPHTKKRYLLTLCRHEDSVVCPPVAKYLL